MRGLFPALLKSDPLLHHHIMRAFAWTLHCERLPVRKRDAVIPIPDAVIENRLLRDSARQKRLTTTKATKITKVFEAWLFFVSFVNFVVEKNLLAEWLNRIHEPGLNVKEMIIARVRQVVDVW